MIGHERSVLFPDPRETEGLDEERDDLKRIIAVWIINRLQLSSGHRDFIEKVGRFLLRLRGFRVGDEEVVE